MSRHTKQSFMFGADVVGDAALEYKWNYLAQNYTGFGDYVDTAQAGGFGMAPDAQELFIQAHGADGTIGYSSAEAAANGQGVSIDYRSIFSQLPESYHTVFVDSCFAGTALEAANEARPGTLILPSVSDQMFNTTGASARVVADSTTLHQHFGEELNARDMFTARAAIYQWEKTETILADNAHLVPQTIDAADNAREAMPDFAIAGLGVVDMQAEMDARMGVGVSDEARTHLKRLLDFRPDSDLPPQEYMQYVAPKLAMVDSVADKMAQGTALADTELGIAHALTFAEIDQSGALDRLIEQAKGQMPDTQLAQNAAGLPEGIAHDAGIQSAVATSAVATADQIAPPVQQTSIPAAEPQPLPDFFNGNPPPTVQPGVLDFSQFNLSPEKLAQVQQLAGSLAACGVNGCQSAPDSPATAPVTPIMPGIAPSGFGVV